jgi:hypothetical protein
VQQDEVEVGVWSRFAPPQATDGGQRDIGTPAEQAGEPGVVRVAEFRAQPGADKPGPAQYAGPDLVE